MPDSNRPLYLQEILTNLVYFVANILTNKKDILYLSQKPVDIDRLLLTKAVDPEYRLDVMRRVPGGVKDNDSVGTVQVDAQTPSSCGYKEQS